MYHDRVALREKERKEQGAHAERHDGRGVAGGLAKVKGLMCVEGAFSSSAREGAITSSLPRGVHKSSRILRDLE